MKEHNVEQGSAEWHQLRMGRITSTRTKDVFKSDNLPVVDELIAEKVNGNEMVIDAMSGYVSEAMQLGTEREPIARQLYIDHTGYTIDQVGFCTHSELDWLGMSPDGLTPDRKGAIEIKCPGLKEHIRTLRMGGYPVQYKYQLMQYFLVNEKLEWLDFVSYCPEFEYTPLYIYRVNRAMFDLDDTMGALIKFWAKFEKYYSQLIF